MLPSAAMSLCWNILRGVKPQAPGLLPRLPHGIPVREGMLWLGGGFALSEQTKSSLCSWGYFRGSHQHRAGLIQTSVALWDPLKHTSHPGSPALGTHGLSPDICSQQLRMARHASPPGMLQGWRAPWQNASSRQRFSLAVPSERNSRPCKHPAPLFPGKIVAEIRASSTFGL